MKIVINTCYGGFGLSQEAYQKLNEWGIPIVDYPTSDNFEDEKVIFRGGFSESIPRLWDAWLSDERDNPLLVRVVEELGDAANGPYAKLKVVEIPDGLDYIIDEYDGIETIHEPHRTWH